MWPPRRLHEAGPPGGQPELGRLFGQPADVGLGAGRDEGVQHRGVHPLVLADARVDVAGEADEEVGVELGDDLARAPLVVGVAEGPEEADGDRLDALLLDQPADLAADVVLAQLDQHLAGFVDPLVDLGDVALADDVGRPRLLLQVELDLADAAVDVDRLLEAAGGEQADPAALALGDRVGDDRGAVDEPGAVAHQRLDLDPELGGGVADRRGDALGVVGRGRQRLGPDQIARVVGDDDVGEGAADVNSNSIHGPSLIRVGCRRVIAGRDRCSRRRRCAATPR